MMTGAHEDTVRAVTTNLYVDDGVISAIDNENAFTIAIELIDIMMTGGLTLRKFVSTSKNFMEALHPDQLVPEMKNVDLNRDSIPGHRC